LAQRSKPGGSWSGTASVRPSSISRRFDRSIATPSWSRAANPIVTVEEHTVFGGMGSAVAEVVVEAHPTRMRLLGVPGVFAPTGSARFLLEHFGLDAAGIRDAARTLVQA
jgi:transketolase